MANIFKANLSGDQETGGGTPSKATGFATFELNEAGDALSYGITIKGLDFGPLLGKAPQTSSQNDDVKALRFHVGGKGTNGPVALGIYNPEQDTDDRITIINADGSTTINGIWEITDPASESLSAYSTPLKAASPGALTNLYLNVYTNKFPNGEIRGQIGAYTGKLFPGTDKADNITGSAGDDIIYGKSKNDVLSGGAGDDLFNGNIGNDTIDGGLGNDTIFGGKDNDALFGKDGGDVILGNLGTDNIVGGEGDDLLFGNESADTIEGNAGNDTIFGGKDNDSLSSGTGNDYLSGDLGNDTISAVDITVKNPGVGEIDTLVGGEGADLFILGKGNQIYYNDGIDAKSGQSDYAIISDFNVSQDVIQLGGTAANYAVASAPTGLPSGSAIFRLTGGQNELIAVVEDVSNLNLEGNYFSFV